MKTNATSTSIMMAKRKVKVRIGAIVAVAASMIAGGDASVSASVQYDSNTNTNTRLDLGNDNANGIGVDGTGSHTRRRRRAQVQSGEPIYVPVEEVSVSVGDGNGIDESQSSEQQQQQQQSVEEQQQPTPPPSPPAPLCSCSPRTYDFRVNFSGLCTASYDTLGDNAGVEGSLCFYTKGGSPEDLGDGDIEFGGGGGGVGRIRGRGLRMGSDSDSDSGAESERVSADASEGIVSDSSLGIGSDSKWWESLLQKVSFASHYQHAAKYIQLRQQQQQQHQRLVQDFDTTPAVITSVTFVEADSTKKLNIINQNSTYFATSLSDGDVITYPSISAQLDEDLPLSDQTDKFPGGVMMVLFGVNDDNLVVQNTVVWGYDVTECDAQPLDVDDRIGWMALDGFEPPRNAFCPAVTDAPTSNPSESPTTASPSASPTNNNAEPTTSPVEAMPTEGPSETQDIVTSELKPTMSPFQFVISSENPTHRSTTKKPTMRPTTRKPTMKPTMRATKAAKAESSSKSSKKDGKSGKGQTTLVEGGYVYDNETVVHDSTKPYELFPKSSKSTKTEETMSATAAITHPHLLFTKSAKIKSSPSAGGEATTAKAKAAKLFKPKASKEEESHYNNGYDGSIDDGHYGNSNSKSSKSKSPEGMIQVPRPPVPEPTKPQYVPWKPEYPTVPGVTTPAIVGGDSTPSPSWRSSLLTGAQLDAIMNGITSYSPTVGANADATVTTAPPTENIVVNSSSPTTAPNVVTPFPTMTVVDTNNGNTPTSPIIADEDGDAIIAITTISPTVSPMADDTSDPTTSSYTTVVVAGNGNVTTAAITTISSAPTVAPIPARIDGAVMVVPTTNTIIHSFSPTGAPSSVIIASRVTPTSYSPTSSSPTESPIEATRSPTVPIPPTVSPTTTSPPTIEPYPTYFPTIPEPTTAEPSYFPTVSEVVFADARNDVAGSSNGQDEDI